MDVFYSIGIEFDLSNNSYRELDLDLLDIDLQDKNKIYWFHNHLSQSEILNKLKEKLDLSSELIDLCQKEESVPELKDTNDSLTLRIQFPITSQLTANQTISFESLILHLTARYCFTASSQTVLSLKTFRETCSKAIRYAKTPCFILFLILDNTINDYASMLFSLEEEVEQFDLDIRASHDNLYHEMMNTKKQVMKMKRCAASICDILMRISGRKIPVISEACRSSLNNLFDHSKIILNEADAIRDIVNGILDQINNGLMQRINETMRILTVFASVFMPLTLITGIYGMNFWWMPELSWKYGYFSSLFLMVICVLLTLGWFKKMKWF